jgi:phosphatidylserine/phosphatidylglycerophosphate/cardiolipin synthase-like enzyme
MNVGDDYSSGGRRDATRPGFRDTDIEITGPEVKKALAIFMRAAHPAITISNGYFMPTPKLRGKMIAAARRA